MSTTTIRAGVIGASLKRGWGGVVHLPSLAGLPGFEIAAVCTTNPESAQATAAAYDVPHAFTDARELIECPDVDLVSVCVKSSLHYELAKAAVLAGKHVYCEWPLVQTAAQATELAELADAKGVHHVVGLQARCSPTILKARELVSSGYVGRVISATVRYGSMTNGASVDSSRTYMVDGTTHVGLLEIHGGHVLDTVRFCLGDFASVSSLLAVRFGEVLVQDTGEKLPRSAPDQILLNGVLDSGAVVSAHIQGGKINASSFALQIQGDAGDLEIYTRGNHAVQIETLELRGANGQVSYQHHEAARHAFQPARPLDVIEPDEHYSWVPEALRVQPFYNTAQLYAQLGRDIRGGEFTVPSFSTAAELSRLLEGMQRSSATGSCLQPV